MVVELLIAYLVLMLVLGPGTVLYGFLIVVLRRVRLTPGRVLLCAWRSHCRHRHDDRWNRLHILPLVHGAVLPPLVRRPAQPDVVDNLTPRLVSGTILGIGVWTMKKLRFNIVMKGLTDESQAQRGGTSSTAAKPVGTISHPNPKTVPGANVATSSSIPIMCGSLSGTLTSSPWWSECPDIVVNFTLNPGVSADAAAPPPVHCAAADGRRGDHRQRRSGSRGSRLSGMSAFGGLRCIIGPWFRSISPGYAHPGWKTSTGVLLNGTSRWPASTSTPPAIPGCPSHPNRPNRSEFWLIAAPSLVVFNY